MKLVLIAVLLLGATTNVAQQGGAADRNPQFPQPITEKDLSADIAGTLNRLAQSMGRYARDISEIPLTVESTVTTFDSSGRERRTTTSSHTMQFVRRSYGEGVVRRQLHVNKPGLHRVSLDEVNGDSATAVLALMFDNGKVSSAYRYNLVLHVVSKRLEMGITNDRPCEGFDPKERKEERLWCGEMHLVVDSETLEPLGASFTAGGFPKTFGKVRYMSFKFVEEFQKVAVEGSGVPFLLPAKVRVTYESDRGRTDIESKFSLKSNSAIEAQ